MERRYIYDAKAGLLLDLIPELQITLSAVTRSIIQDTDRLFDETPLNGCDTFRPRSF